MGSDLAFRRGRRPCERIGAFLLAGTLLSLAAAAGASATPRHVGHVVAELAPFANTAAFRGHGRLAFVSRGRLFVLDGEAGRLVAVSTPGQHAADPQFSPDGRWLTYSIGTSQLWLARADGRSAHRLLGSTGGSWLPDGELLTDTGVWRLSASGAASRTEAAPVGLVAWALDGTRLAFVTSTLSVSLAKPSRGIQRLEVSSSLGGPRRTWYETRESFTKKSGFGGNFVAGVVVLPRDEGLVFQLDPDRSASVAADGLSLYLLRRPGGVPRRLGFTLAQSVAVARSGGLAIVNGGDRYAWVTKTVETCDVATAACSPVSAPSGELSFDPAWSPAGRTLAFVEAPASTVTNFFQSTLVRWYATHTLWLLSAGSSTPRELVGTTGASVPTWSSDGKSLLYVSGNALWLVPTLASPPVKVAGPLFPPDSWPSYYGQVNWRGQFAWAS